MQKDLPRAPLPQDRVLSFAEVRQVLGCSHATFYRDWRNRLPVVEVSERRRGVRLSDLEAAMAARTTRPGHAA